MGIDDEIFFVLRVMIEENAWNRKDTSLFERGNGTCSSYFPRRDFLFLS